MNQNNQQPVEAAGAVQAEPAPLKSTQEARAYLVDFMMQHFSDKTFHRYIRGEGRSNVLAGDFAWQMATALRKIEAATHPAQPVEAAGAVPLDLSELDLWSPIAGSKMEVDNACGQYVRFADVQSLLATHPAEPVGGALVASDDLMRMIDQYASKRALQSFLEASRVATDRKDRGPRKPEHDAQDAADTLRRKIAEAIAAPAGAAEALQAPVGGALVAKKQHEEPVGHVKDHFKGTDKAYRNVIWADRTFAMDVPDGAPLYAAPAGALVAMAEQVETDMADRLRRIVTNIGEGPIAVQSKLLFQAADECDRFYNGMMNWKANPQAKDRTIIELRESAPTESAAAPADLSKLESAFKIALGSLALHDMDEANRIGKMYRDSLATHQPIPTKGNGDTDTGAQA